MLDLEALVGEMRDLATEVVASAQETRERRGRAMAQLRIASSLTGLRQAVINFDQDMALPVLGGNMGLTYPPPPAGDYTVIATDGSQVPPDFHNVAPWYVVNGGAAVFRYAPPPGRARCRLSSHPSLKPPGRLVADTAVLSEHESDGRAAAVQSGGRVEIDRLAAELNLAIAMLEEEADPGRSVLLLDGPLVQWRMLQDLKTNRSWEQVVGIFRNLMETARRLEVAVAGYISRSRAVEWVTLLRFSLCPEVVNDGRLCGECATSLLRRDTPPDPNAHHASLAGARDIELAGELLAGLPAGARTEVIELRSKAWSSLSGSDSAAGFFYMSTGSEIARVELPQWVWEFPERMTRLHGALWDQCEAGHGYPMVLAEAHEAAVVRAADREAFYRLIERLLSEHGLDEPAASAKAGSKRRPMA